MNDEIENLVTEYSRFNASRTLSMNTPSEFEVQKIGNATLLIDRARPCPGICNRVFGFDSSSIDTLSEICSRYPTGQPRFDLRPESIGPEVAHALISAGYNPYESLVYLTAEPSDCEKPTIDIERWTESRADEFVRLLERSGAPYSDANWNLRRKHYCTDQFRTYLAFQDDQPVGWATMFLHGKVGMLANAFTFEAYRRRGCHSALLRARIAEASRLGLNRVVTDVEPQSESFMNCRRAGFDAATTHTIWQPNIDA